MRFLQPIPCRLPTLALALLLVSVLSAVVAACPTCKEALAGDPLHQQMVTGYFYSILFMMSMPFVLLGTFGSFAYLSIRRARTAADSQSDLHREADDETDSPSR